PTLAATLFPYTTLFRSGSDRPVERRQLLALGHRAALGLGVEIDHRARQGQTLHVKVTASDLHASLGAPRPAPGLDDADPPGMRADRKSTRLNSSHGSIS